MGRRYDALRTEVKDRDGWRCRGCGRAGRLEVHHIRPRYRGGSDRAENLTTLCRQCHLGRHRRPVGPGADKWRTYLEEVRK